MGDGLVLMHDVFAVLLQKILAGRVTIKYFSGLVEPIIRRLEMPRIILANPHHRGRLLALKVLDAHQTPALFAPLEAVNQLRLTHAPAPRQLTPKPASSQPPLPTPSTKSGHIDGLNKRVPAATLP